MTDIGIRGDYEGTGGEFRLKSSFPKVLKPCDTLLDKLKTKEKWIFVAHHGEKDGKTTVSTTEVKRK